MKCPLCVTQGSSGRTSRFLVTLVPIQSSPCPRLLVEWDLNSSARAPPHYKIWPSFSILFPPLYLKNLCSRQTGLLSILLRLGSVALSLRNLIWSYSSPRSPQRFLVSGPIFGLNFKLPAGISFHEPCQQLKFNTAKVCLYFPSPLPPPYSAPISIQSCPIVLDSQVRNSRVWGAFLFPCQPYLESHHILLIHPNNGY